MATLKDVAAETGLTVSTVSRVLNNRGYISDKTRKKVYDAMAKLNYTPNEVARSLSKKTNNTIGVIVPHIRHPYFAELISNLERACYNRNYKMFIFNSREKQEKENEYQKVGYAKVDTDIYFTTIYESNQEGCVFKLTFTCQSKGKFNIIALDKIQSRNDWQKKVECSGVSIKEATDFRLEDEGICEKIDDNTWKVTKPLKIKLIK